ncbi:metalloprotease PmbA [Aliidiomarina haloalkalitolerans]|uniref:Metalloprotease PmbA n=1 Tax=Aliidiomarina haloalkalitolerans TaxID=859059 RepID=A0A432VSR2_9GAMM|nr:metalloprotease PmbA [Aliidiomarina haloalkalitolerans]RUO19444.1 metalloprotease PmbA [Aliidiomarina haloalkalitolerans]
MTQEVTIPEITAKEQLQPDLERAVDAVEEALKQAKKAGASAAECAISHSRGLSVSTRLAEVETVEFNQDGSLGITVYRRHKDGSQSKGSASTSDLSPAAIRATVEKADAIARWTEADPAAGLADKELMAFGYSDPELFYPAPQSPEHATQVALACEQAMLNADERIINSDGAHYSSHCGFRVYGNSHEFLGHYMSSRQSLSCMPIAKQGDVMERDYAYTIARDPQRLLAPEAVALEAVANTVARLGARSVPTCTVPVIFHRDLAHHLFGQFAGAISGGNLYRKSTFLLDHLGKQVFPSWLSIQEEPLLAGGLATTPFDHEGVRTEARDIVNDGVVSTYLLTSYAARKLGMQSTGHAGGIHNWFIRADAAHTATGLDALCKQMGTGLLVTELMGQGVNLVTGDYSRGAAGFWVENGEIQFPVTEVTVAGNLRDMFANIVAIGDDVDPRHGVLSGSVLVSAMKVAGQ